MEIMLSKKQLLCVMLMQLFAMVVMTIVIVLSEEINLMYSVIVTLLGIGFFITFKLLRDG